MFMRTKQMVFISVANYVSCKSSVVFFTLFLLLDHSITPLLSVAVGTVEYDFLVFKGGADCTDDGGDTCPDP